VVHELSQPITSMSMFASSCRRLAQHDGHTRLAETAEHMLSMVQRIKSLIEQLRHFSRKAPDKTSPVLLSEVLANALTVLQFKQEAAGCRPLTFCAPDVVIMADALQLEQVCINLIHNALDALHTMPADERRVDIAVEQLPDAVLLSVTDNGSGIDPAIRDKLFTPFFTTKKSGEGRGLGLAIVDNIVRSMHGAIETHNVLPHGTRFSLRLPLTTVPDNPHE
jgi:two-component system C4-dicarboxylate transport sensor histidine kinase DctB